MNQGSFRIYRFSPPRTPLGRLFAFLGLIAVLVASFFIGIFVLAIALGVAIVGMIYGVAVRGAARRREQAGREGSDTAGGTVVDGEYEVVVIEERNDERD